MSFFHTSMLGEGLRKAEYRPSHEWTAPTGYTKSVPASVYVAFEGVDVTMSLDIAEAETLMNALAVALVEHAAALKNSSPEAVP